MPKFIYVLVFLVLGFLPSAAQKKADSMFTVSQAWQVFHTPKDSCRTKVWWFHGETETTREGITADLEAFKRAGIGGVV